MSQPQFAIGQNVTVAYSKHHRDVQGIYRIIGTLPNGDGPVRYRIKGETDKHERVIDEMHLTADKTPAEPAPVVIAAPRKPLTPSAARRAAAEQLRPRRVR